MANRTGENAVQLGEMPRVNGERDAVHVAVIAAYAYADLKPGVGVGLRSDGVLFAGEGFLPPVGIVDPFRVGTIQVGEPVWVCLYPRSVTSLRHVWSSKTVPEEI